MISAGEEFTATTWAGTLHWPQGNCHHQYHYLLDHHHHLDHLGYDHCHDWVFQNHILKNLHDYQVHQNNLHTHYEGNSSILQWHPGYRARGFFIFWKSDLEADLIFITFILLKARDCYFTDESSLAFYDKYTFSNCRSKTETKTKTMLKNEDIWLYLWSLNAIT